MNSEIKKIINIGLKNKAISLRYIKKENALFFKDRETLVLKKIQGVHFKYGELLKGINALNDSGEYKAQVIGGNISIKFFNIGNIYKEVSAQNNTPDQVK